MSTFPVLLSSGSSTPAGALSRRTLLKGTGVAAVAGLALPALRAQPATLKIGQSIAMSGPLADLGLAMHQGAKGCFDALNAKGGVNGQVIELQARDDAYDVAKAVSNVKAFLADDSVFCLFNCMGTPMVAASLPLANEAGVPYFAPFTGALLARPKDVRNVFNIRASYPEEAEELVKHLVTIGLRKIAVVQQNNAFGKEIFDGAEKALGERSLSSVVSAKVENDASDVQAAIDTIAKAAPEAVIIGLAGKPAMEFIKGMRRVRRGLPLYTTSVMGAASSVKALGEDAVGLTVSQVVPLPSNTVKPVVRDFQRDWKASGTSLEPSHLALEGYINARVFAEALRKSGRSPARSAFLDAAWGLRGVDMGGFRIDARGPGTNASRFIELTMISRGGQFIR